jgi:hypothetical protein
MAEPFPLNPARLYDVAPDGMPSTRGDQVAEWLGPRHRRMLGWAATGMVLTGGLAGGTVLCFALGARLAAAGLALATVAVAPLLALGPVLDWWRHRRRRRHRIRPAGFPGG